MKFRCPKHDKLFDSQTDQSAPGEGKNPANGHVDCPLCKREAEGVKPISREAVKKAAGESGVPFDTAAQQAVAQGYELEG